MINNNMKFIRFITFLLMFFNWNTGYAKNMTIYDFSFKDIDGNLVNLSKFKGKPIFMVNTASRAVLPLNMKTFKIFLSILKILT